MMLDNLQGDSHSHNPKVPLKFVIEGKEYETFDQYKTGAELKQLAGIPLDTELFCQLANLIRMSLLKMRNR